MERQLTAKEQKVIDEFEKARPGFGAKRSATTPSFARQNILNPNSGWVEIIADMDESEIVARTRFKRNG